MYTDALKYQNSIVKTPEQEFNEVFQKVSSHVTVAIKDDSGVVGFGALQEMADHFRLTPLRRKWGNRPQSDWLSFRSSDPGLYHADHHPLMQRDFINNVFEASGFTLESEAFIDKIYSKQNVEISFEKLFSFWNIEAVYQN